MINFGPQAPKEPATKATAVDAMTIEMKVQLNKFSKTFFKKMFTTNGPVVLTGGTDISYRPSMTFPRPSGLHFDLGRDLGAAK